jgi:hypothetical protein
MHFRRKRNEHENAKSLLKELSKDDEGDAVNCILNVTLAVRE